MRLADIGKEEHKIQKEAENIGKRGLTPSDMLPLR